MKLDTDKLKEIYGESILYDIKENLEDISDNMNYLKTKKFTDIYDIFETNPYLFFNTPDIFQNKVKACSPFYVPIHKSYMFFCQISEQVWYIWHFRWGELSFSQRSYWSISVSSTSHKKLIPRKENICKP